MERAQIIIQGYVAEMEQMKKYTTDLEEKSSQFVLEHESVLEESSAVWQLQWSDNSLIASDLFITQPFIHLHLTLGPCCKMLLLVDSAPFIYTNSWLRPHYLPMLNWLWLGSDHSWPNRFLSAEMIITIFSKLRLHRVAKLNVEYR